MIKSYGRITNFLNTTSGKRLVRGFYAGCAFAGMTAAGGMITEQWTASVVAAGAVMAFKQWSSLRNQHFASA